MPAPLSRFEQLDFDGFRSLAADPGLSRHEKVGFPDRYREGREEAIYRDIAAKLGLAQLHRGTVLEIGPGCSRLPEMLIEQCARSQSRLLLVDSAEMLALLRDASAASIPAGHSRAASRSANSIRHWSRLGRNSERPARSSRATRLSTPLISVISAVGKSPRSMASAARSSIGCTKANGVISMGVGACARRHAVPRRWVTSTPSSVKPCHADRPSSAATTDQFSSA